MQYAFCHQPDGLVYLDPKYADATTELSSGSIKNFRSHGLWVGQEFSADKITAWRKSEQYKAGLFPLEAALFHGLDLAHLKLIEFREKGKKAAYAICHMDACPDPHTTMGELITNFDPPGELADFQIFDIVAVDVPASFSDTRQAAFASQSHTPS